MYKYAPCIIRALTQKSVGADIIRPRKKAVRIRRKPMRKRRPYRRAVGNRPYIVERMFYCIRSEK